MGSYFKIRLKNERTNYFMDQRLVEVKRIIFPFGFLKTVEEMSEYR